MATITGTGTGTIGIDTWSSYGITSDPAWANAYISGSGSSDDGYYIGHIQHVDKNGNLYYIINGKKFVSKLFFGEAGLIDPVDRIPEY